MPPHDDAPNLKIAVIDDDDSARSGLRSQLQALGHESYLFESGEAFLAQAGAQAFDCVLLDIWFKNGMTGLELMRYFPGAGVAAPVVLITAEPDHETAFDAGRLGVKAYLPKPVRRVPLVEALRKALETPPALGQVNALSQADWEALLRAAEHKLDAALLRPLKELTPTEALVFRLLASEGPSNKEIARRLDKNVKVVEAHRASVIKKLGTGKLILLHGMLTTLLQATGHSKP